MDPPFDSHATRQPPRHRGAAPSGDDARVHPLVDPVLTWYRSAARDLPWRAPDCSPWGVLVSEVMLQQTPVSRVEPRWREWTDRWPTPEALVAAPTAEVLRAWGSLGYPRRALRLVECARVVVDRHDGELPADHAALLALPGVGPYTAGAVLAFAHGRRALALDTNVRRVLARAVDGVALPPPHLGAAETRRAEALLPDDDATAARWSQAVMELGALVCTARVPRCGKCPLADRCAWLRAGRPADAHAARRRRQAWAGTDRQARGRIMGVLRDSQVPVSDADLATCWPADEQRARALAGLVADGLVERVATGHRLPRTQVRAADGDAQPARAGR